MNELFVQLENDFMDTDLTWVHISCMWRRRDSNWSLIHANFMTSSIISVIYPIFPRILDWMIRAIPIMLRYVKCLVNFLNLYILKSEPIVLGLTRFQCLEEFELFGGGPDKIPLTFLRRTANKITEPLLTSFNCSLATSFFPAEWKSSYITSLFKFKSGDLTDILICKPFCNSFPSHS